MENNIRITIDQDTSPEMAKTVECEGFYLVAFRKDDIGLHVMGRRTMGGWVSLFTSNSDGSTEEIRNGIRLADAMNGIGRSSGGVDTLMKLAELVKGEKPEA